MREPTYGELATELADTLIERQLMEAARDAIHFRHEEMCELAEDLAKTLEYVSDGFCEHRLIDVHCALLHAERLGVLDPERHHEDEPDDESEDIDERDIPFLWRPDEPAMGQETDHNPLV